MCGRYATTQTSASLNDAFGARMADSFVELEPDYNMAPTKRGAAGHRPEIRGRTARSRAAHGQVGTGAELGQGSVHRQPHDQRPQ